MIDMDTKPAGMKPDDIERLILFTARVLWAHENNEKSVFETLYFNHPDLTEEDAFLLIKAAKILNSNWS